MPHPDGLTTGTLVATVPHALVAQRDALSFDVAGMYCAIPIHFVEEVLQLLPVQPIPGAPVFLKGMISIRGSLTPLVDARERLRCTRSAPEADDPHIITLKVKGRMIGLLVDEALDLVSLPEGGLSATEDMSFSPSFLDSMVEAEGTVYRVLNPDLLLAPDEAGTVSHFRRTRSASHEQT